MTAKKQNHLLLALGLAVAAFLIYAVLRTVIAGERSLLAIAKAPFNALFEAANAIGGFFTGLGTPDPAAPNADAAAAGITNIDGSPVTNAQADAALGSSILGIPQAGQPGSVLNADGSFQIFRP